MGEQGHIWAVLYHAQAEGAEVFDLLLVDERCARAVDSAV